MPNLIIKFVFSALLGITKMLLENAEKSILRVRTISSKQESVQVATLASSFKEITALKINKLSLTLIVLNGKKVSASDAQ